MRRAPDERWSAEMIQGIKGTPAAPKPGSGSDIMPTYAKHREEMKTVNYEKAPELENAVSIHDDLQCHRSRQPVGSPFTQVSDINYDGSMGVATDDERG